jgi:integrase
MVILTATKVYWTDGQPITKTFKRKVDAELWRRKVLCDRDEAELHGYVIKDSVLVNAFVQKWFEEKVKNRLSPATQSKYEGELRLWILPVVGLLKLRDVKIEHANQILQKLVVAKKKPAGINNVLCLLQGVLNDAVRWQYLIKNPLQGFKLLKKDPPRELFWSKTEVDQFLRANVNDPYYPVYLMALNTGMRRGEIAALQWDRVSFDRNCIDVTRTYSSRFGLQEWTKTKVKKMIPMNTEVRKLLWTRWQLQKGPFVFCKGSGEPIDTTHVYREFMKAEKRAGIITTIRFHDTRHTFASHFMMNGGNIYDLQKILGHKKIEQTMRYAHLSPAHLEKAINLVNFSGSTDLAHEEACVANQSVLSVV